MTITIGRLVLPDGAVESLSDNGAEVTISGRLFDPTSDVNLLTATRDRLLGTLEADAVPLVWGEDPAYDGFVTVKGGEVSQAPGILQSGEVPYSISLGRMAGGNYLPGIESVLQGGYRPNGVGFANSAHGYNATHATNLYQQPEWAVPGNAIEVQAITPSQVTGPANDVFTIRGFRGDYATEVVRWAVKPADYYQGSCLIEELVGSTWVPVQGRQHVCTDVTKLRVSNGTLGARFVHPSIAGKLGVRFYNPTTWATTTTFLGMNPNSASAVDYGITAITVVRNDPEEVRLRLSLVSSGGPVRTFGTVDVSLRRGLDYVTAVFPAGYPGSSAQVRLDATASVASTVSGAGNEGLYQTTASGGFRPWILTNQANTRDLAVGSVTYSGSSAVAFGMGPLIDTARVSSYSGTVLRWFAPLTERQRFVGR